MSTEQTLRLALERLHSVCKAMDLEVQAERPTEEEYQRAMAAAESALRDAP
jgi:hypothetical protein